MHTSTPRILLCAEDDADDIELFCNTVEEIDPSIKVIHAENGKVFLQKLEQLSTEGTLPCLVTLDINMPVMGGKEALKEMKQHREWASIPVVIYTTSPHSLYKELEQQYGAIIITKPGSLDGIYAQVKEILSYCS